MEQETIIIVSVLSAAWFVVFVMVVVALFQLTSLRKSVAEMQATGRIRVQKLKMDNDKNHAFHNPGLVPDEELSRRGYSMYMPDTDVESGRHTEPRQTGGQFVEELTKELDMRQQRSTPSFQDDMRNQRSFQDDMRNQRSFQDDMRNQRSAPPFQEFDMQQRQSSPPFQELNQRQSAPPFLLQSIQENKQKTRNLVNPVANGNTRQSDTNPNFIY